MRNWSAIEWSLLAVIVVLVVLIGFGAWLSWWNYATCHVGHSHVYWRSAYSQTVGDATVFHPARCERQWVCDLRCSDLDEGGLEAHDDHEPETTATTYEARCQP